MTDTKQDIKNLQLKIWLINHCGIHQLRESGRVVVATMANE